MFETEQPMEVREAAVIEELRKELESNPKAVDHRMGNLWMNVVPAEGDEISFRGAPAMLGNLDEKPKNVENFLQSGPTRLTVNFLPYWTRPASSLIQRMK